MGDWIDEITEPQDASLWQIARIESLLVSVPYSQQEIDSILTTITRKDLTYGAANRLIDKLKEDFISNDPKDQFNKMFDNGNL